jgi:GntR family transcriptional regulator/MocR family aminotransferase
MRRRSGTRPKIKLTQRSQDTPLYQQLYASLRGAILSGVLAPGVRLPSTRALASELNVSRNTVLNAYQQLLSEGYLGSVSGGGTFVSGDLPDAMLITSPQSKAEARRTELEARTRATFPTEQVPSRSSTLPDPTETGFGRPRPFRADVPALDAFPYKLWSRLVIRQARHMPSSAFAYQDRAGYLPLREAIAAHVSVARQVRCDADQVIIVSGSQGALDLIARLVLNVGDSVWMEDPGFPGARGAFIGVGANVVPVPVDDDGLIVEAGIARAPAARLVYLTPSHQFPLGVTMSLARRLALLEWANQAGAYVLEDDYDSEYRYAGRPLAAMQGLDTAERVIYVGTFSKVLFPALRLGYLIAPRPLIGPVLALRRFVDVHPHVFEQVVLTEFIEKGHFVRHIRRMRGLYAERRTALIDSLGDLPIEVDSPKAGIHSVGWLPDDLDAHLLVQAGLANDLELTPISAFTVEPLPRQGLLLGYGGFSPETIRSAAGRLAAAIRSI